MPKPSISADSRITETPTLYIDNIDPKHRVIVPRVMDDPVRGQVYVIDGMKDTIPLPCGGGRQGSVDLKHTGCKI